MTGEFAGTSLEFLPPLPPRGAFEDRVVDLMVDMSVAAGRPLNWNILTVSEKTLPDALARLAVGDAARARGGKVVALTMPDTPAARFSFRSGFVLDMVPGLHDFLFLPLDERLAILRDPDRRAELRRRAEEPSAYGHLVDWGSRQLIETFSPQTKRFAGRLVGDIAAEEGKDPFEVLMDIVVADELKTTFSNRSVLPTASRLGSPGAGVARPAGRHWRLGCRRPSRHAGILFLLHDAAGTRRPRAAGHLA